MKKTLYAAVIAVILGVASVAMLTRASYTSKCIDYRCQQIKIPLYLKLLDFFDRHLNYLNLTMGIVDGVTQDQEKVMRIFRWTVDNIRKVPPGMPIVDNHVWHTIIRGYGADDQASDVFTTLCNYAGLQAFYEYTYAQKGMPGVPLSFVRLGTEWFVFDPYRGIIFVDGNNKLISLDSIKDGAYWQTSGNRQDTDHPDYGIYFTHLRRIKNTGLHRSSIQSPLNRLIFQIKKARQGS
ncbi:MAG: transglutaminase-like domain-containing protein [Candidatus Omnitrophica bacterium]|nr:transglutaminase-like domain-containing protein [Candidatus Omnitrophota bacterium]